MPDIYETKSIVEGSNNLTHLGAFHMIDNEDYEPQRNNNFEVRIYGLDNLKTSTGTKISQGYAQDCLTLSVASMGQINTNVGVLTVPYGNTKVKFAGLPEVSDSDIVFNDYLGRETERVIAAWHRLVFNPVTEKIGKAKDYKKSGVLIETAPDGSHPRVWKLHGCWPSNVQYGAYDHNGGATRQITMTLTYDIAEPLDDGLTFA